MTIEGLAITVDVKVVEFTVPGQVRGKGRPIASTISGHVRMRTPAKTAAYEGLIALAAQRALNGRPQFEGAVHVVLRITHEPPASWSKRKRAAALASEILPTCKPDIDNVLKAVGDGCNGVLWRDDAQIATASVVRRYGEPCGLHVLVMNAVG
mgnify:CR=1 FL=1